MTREARSGRPDAPSPREEIERPHAPTPEQTNHWLRDFDLPRPASAVARPAPLERRFASESPESPQSETAMYRPRSPTPTKMLAWEEEVPIAGGSSPSRAAEDSDHEGRGDQMDGLIARLIEACQMNDVQRAFAFYDRLRYMKVPLFEGVYKLIIECCMRTQQLGHAMQFYETLKSSGQRVSPNLAMVLMEACAREQHGDKVHAIWLDWCPAGKPLERGHSEVLLLTVSALIRTMSPDLALEVLRDARRYSRSWLGDADVQLEELQQLGKAACEEAQLGALGELGGSLARSFGELQELLEDLRQECNLQQQSFNECMARRYSGDMSFACSMPGNEELLMEDVDLDLELAAM